MYIQFAFIYSLSECVENFTLSQLWVCVDNDGGGRESVCLQDFELMESRQGFRVDKWQVIPCESSVVKEKESNL